MLGSVLKLYPLNSDVQFIGCAILSRMYYLTESWQWTPGDVDTCGAHLQLAFAILDCEKRDSRSISSAFELILTMHIRTGRDVDRCLRANRRDVMLLMFDAQDEINKSSETMGQYYDFCTRFLPKWKAPVIQTESQIRAPVDIIIDCIRMNAGSAYHLKVGCKQLEKLSQGNADTVKISHQHMAFLSTQVDKDNSENLDRTSIYRADCLWQFLHRCVTTPEAFATFKRSFNIQLLLQTVAKLTFRACFVSVADGWEHRTLLGRCVAIVLNFIRHFLNEPTPYSKHLFLDTNGIDIIVQSICYMYINDKCRYARQHFESARVACMKIFLDIFNSHENGLSAYLAISARKGTTVPMNFVYTLGSDAHINSTFTNFLVNTLFHISLRHRDGINEHCVVTTQHILRLLHVLSQNGDLIHSDIRNPMKRILESANNLIPMIQHRGYYNPPGHVLTPTNSEFASELVAQIDAIVVQYASHLSLHNKALMANSEEMRIYMLSTTTHRARGIEVLPL